MARRCKSLALRAAIQPLELRVLLSQVSPLNEVAVPNVDDFHEATVSNLTSASIGPRPAVVAGEGSTARQPAGALSGKIIFTVGGHGFTAYTGGWHTQRPETNEIVEDLGNQDQMTAL